MSHDEDVIEKVREMAKVSLVTKRISEVQAQNLKLYPFVFFNGVKSVEIDYDLSPKTSVDSDTNEATMEISYSVAAVNSGTRVSYNLTIEPTEENSSVEVRYAALESAVRSLFWSDLQVTISINETPVFRSKP